MGEYEKKKKKLVFPSLDSLQQVVNVVNVVRQFLFSHGDFKESAKAGFCSADEGSDALYRVPESGRISD